MIPIFLAHLARIRARERWPRERLEAFRERQLQRLRAHAVAQSPFYRELHRGLEHAPLDALPPVAKTTMLERFDEIVTDPAVRLVDVRRHMREADGPLPYRGYMIGSSSGSSGEVSITLSNRSEIAYNLAGASRSRAFAGFAWNPLRPRRAAEVVATLTWTPSNQFARMEKSRFAPVLHLDAGAPMDKLVPQLNAWQPELLESFATTLGILAKEQIDGRLQIAPAYIGAGGETMTPEVRALIHRAWKQDPFDYYGTIEGGTHGVECREGRRLHLQDDLAIVEVVDAENRPVPVGEWGARVLVTPLWRRTQPLIRFEIDDQVRLSDEPCACGRPFPVIDGLIGRSPVPMRFARADGAGEVEVDWLMLPSIAALPVIWRRLSHEGDHLVLRLAGVLPEADVPAAARGVEQSLLELGARPIRVEVEILPEVPRTAAGKAVLATSGAPANTIGGGTA